MLTLAASASLVWMTGGTSLLELGAEASPWGDALCSAFFFLRCFSSSFSARRRPLAAVSSMASPPYSSRRPCWAVSRSCVRRRSEPSSSPLCRSSFGAETAFSLTRSPSVGFSLILSIGRHDARSEGFVVIIWYSLFLGK